MANRITPGQIRKTNRHIIYEYIYSQRGEKVSQQDIAYSLGMSRPTVAYNLSEMEGDGLIFKNGQLNACQIGRKAASYSVVADYRIAIGVEIMRHTVKIIAINLYGEKINSAVINIEYKNHEFYFKSISENIQSFISSLKLNKNEKEKILGIGFAIQGLVSKDGKTVIYGAILDCTGLSIDVFTHWLDYPCSFIHEPDGAALSELWVSPELTNAIYLSLSRHLGGAVISNRKIISGKHRHSATFEHIQAVRNGEICYCGRRGCFETVCSTKALLGEEDFEKFFKAVREGSPEEARRWRKYLEYLGVLIGYLRLINDTNYILGGHLAPYIIEEDVEFIYNYIRERATFQDENDYILISRMPSHNITIGAALPYILSFLNSM